MKLKTKNVAKNLNLFNAMPAKPYRELLENRQEKRFTKNYIWNPFNVDVVTRKLA